MNLFLILFELPLEAKIRPNITVLPYKLDSLSKGHFPSFDQKRKN